MKTGLSEFHELHTHRLIGISAPMCRPCNFFILKNGIACLYLLSSSGKIYLGNFTILRDADCKKVVVIPEHHPVPVNGYILFRFIIG